VEQREWIFLCQIVLRHYLLLIANFYLEEVFAFVFLVSDDSFDYVFAFIA
jgi:hypothetical protein